MNNSILKDHFKRYKDAKEVFVSGNSLFLSKSAALSYGSGAVKRVTRAEVFSQTEDKAEEPLTPIMSYTEMKAFVTKNKIPVKDFKKETLMAALSAISKN